MKRSGYVKQGAELLPPWRNVEMFGRAAWDREHPKRYYLLIRQGLQLAHLRYWERVTAWNEYHHPIFKGRECAAGFVTIDFIVRMPNKKPLALLIDNKASTIKPHERTRWESKSALLRSRNIPVLILKTYQSSQEYQVIILNEIRRLTRPSWAHPPEGKEDGEHRSG